MLLREVALCLLCTTAENEHSGTQWVVGDHPDTASVDGFGCDVIALQTDLGSENNSIVPYLNAWKIRGRFYKTAFFVRDCW